MVADFDSDSMFIRLASLSCATLDAWWPIRQECIMLFDALSDYILEEYERAAERSAPYPRADAVENQWSPPSGYDSSEFGD